MLKGSLIIASSFIILTMGAACKKSEPSTSTTTQQASGSGTPPGTEGGAKELLSGFSKGEAAQAELTKKLIPSYEQCKSIFASEEIGGKACEPWKEPARSPNARLTPGATQTEVIVSSATTEELRAWTGKAQEFPGGYKRVAEYLKPGLTVYRFTFVEPGGKTGLAFDGLFHIEGKWFLVSKPWRLMGRALRDRRDMHEAKETQE